MLVARGQPEKSVPLKVDSLSASFVLQFKCKSGSGSAHHWWEVWLRWALPEDMGLVVSVCSKCIAWTTNVKAVVGALFATRVFTYYHPLGPPPPKYPGSCFQPRYQCPAIAKNWHVIWCKCPKHATTPIPPSTRCCLSRELGTCFTCAWYLLDNCFAVTCQAVLRYWSYP